MLADLPNRPVNFDPQVLYGRRLEPGWQTTDLCQALPAEAPGEPVEDGSWQIARRLIGGYEFADPSIVRAFYVPGSQLEHRNMVLELRAFGVIRLLVGVRVNEVYDREQGIDGRPVRIWGWNYRTLQGHIEMGQMDWEVWKWLDTGEVQFRVHSLSKYARISNPIVALGVRLFRGHERRVFLDSTKRRMLTFVELALKRPSDEEAVRAAAAELTARPVSQADATHVEVARKARAKDPS